MPDNDGGTSAGAEAGAVGVAFATVFFVGAGVSGELT